MTNGVGLIKYGNAYYNPNKVDAIMDDSNGLSSKIKFSYEPSYRCFDQVTAENFAKALIKAQQTGEIVDVKA